MRHNEWGNPTWGWGPFRYDWYSICSKMYNPDCKTCKAGRWVHKWTKEVDSFIYRRHYRLWFWWHNRPNSSARKRLEALFPGLRPNKPGP
jgi:hypothetical protein